MSVRSSVRKSGEGRLRRPRGDVGRFRTEAMSVAEAVSVTEVVSAAEAQSVTGGGSHLCSEMLWSDLSIGSSTGLTGQTHQV